ncbi:3-deoxy-7-phosphoheptulonate synthase [Streptomyces sp. NPDC021093]|uniref:3-deoxy-7-phosphoheptulonate synthase n=1 Tax=Streptomyces sp. NPDC021093 TaxID=3365112 RepID=UPI0037AAFD6F
MPISTRIGEQRSLARERTTLKTSPTAGSLPAAQQPDWPDPATALAVRRRLAALPPLVGADEVGDLFVRMAQVQRGEAFLLQAGACAEPFGRQAVRGAESDHRLINRMADTVAARLELPVLTVGRVAGQFAKPRSQPVETVDGAVLPVFRGLLVNGPEPDARSRSSDPFRMLAAYQSARMVLDRLHRLDAATGQGRLWTSHEALVLDYEEPLTRFDPVTGEWFAGSTHLPWIGERTRQPDWAHVSLLSAVSNPVACKVGPGIRDEDLRELCERLDPHRRPGRLTLVARLGARWVRERLPELVAVTRRSGHPVTWVCDPMHGNTVVTSDGIKTRHTRDVLDELTGFFEVLGRAGQWPGGVHLEVTGDQVTECVGPGGPAGEGAVASGYRSLCDPRLNGAQAMHMAEAVADLAARH